MLRKYSVLAFVILLSSSSFASDWFRKDKELLQNGDVETLVNGFPVAWRASHHTQGVSITENAAYSGKYGVEINDSWMGRGAGVGFNSIRVSDIHTDSMYEATAMIKVISGEAWFYLKFYNNDSVIVSEEIRKLTAPGDWKQVILRGKAPANATFITLTAYSSSDNTGQFFVDDMSLIQKTRKGLVVGHVFRDLNGDGKQSGDEPNLPDAIISISPGQYFGITDESGNYQIELYDEDDFTATCSYRSKWIKDIAPGNHVITDQGVGVNNSYDFAVELEANVTDLEYNITSTGRARPGFALIYVIDIENNGTLNHKRSSFSIKLDDNLNLDSASGSYTVSNKEITWDVGDFNIGDKQKEVVYMRVKPDVKLLGQKIRSDGGIVIWDTLAEKDTIEQVVRGSYDPNDKSVAPLGIGESGGVPLSTDQFDYVIRFQNTGTDTAFEVIIVDSLSENFDMNTFRNISSSHPYSVDLHREGVVVWTFSDILLPDSNTNEALSHGFIRYSVQPKLGMKVNDQIKNTGEIYFDYNPPIITNTTVNTFVNPTGTPVVPKPDVPLLVYPNPTKGEFYLKFNEDPNLVMKLNLYSTEGRLLRSFENISDSKVRYSIADLPHQMLVYTIVDNRGNMRGQGRLLLAN